MRRLLLALFTVALILFGGIFPLLFPHPSRITKGTYDRIKRGMSQAEVEAICGGPPGDYRTRPREPPESGTCYFAWILHLPKEGPVTRLCWQGDEGEVLGLTDDAGVVIGIGFRDHAKADVGAIELFRWRLNRLKRRWFPPNPMPLPPPP
jgi:hypothetical protein